MPTILISSFLDSDIAISFCPHLNRWCVSHLVIEEAKAGEMTATKQSKDPTTAAFLKEFLSCATNREGFA
jgi:hypothetical protein